MQPGQPPRALRKGLWAACALRLALQGLGASGFSPRSCLQNRFAAGSEPRLRAGGRAGGTGERGGRIRPTVSGAGPCVPLTAQRCPCQTGPLPTLTSISTCSLYARNLAELRTAHLPPGQSHNTE